MPESPKEWAFKIHRDYYQQGSYPLDRYKWIVTTFLKNYSGKRILEIGCGDGGVIDVIEDKSFPTPLEAQAYETKPKG